MVKKITRTLTVTNVVVTCMNAETKEVLNIAESLPGGYKKDEDILKIIKKDALLADNIVPVCVESKQEIESKYTISERDFLKYAEPIATSPAK